MGRPPGKTKTFPRVVELLTEAVKEKGQKAVEAETKLSQSMISRYLKGEGEPSQATLEKLAAYFGKSVAWLRGEEDNTSAKMLLAMAVLASLDDKGVEITDKLLESVLADIANIDIESATEQFVKETGIPEEHLSNYFMKLIGYTPGFPHKPDFFNKIIRSSHSALQNISKKTQPV